MKVLIVKGVVPRTIPFCVINDFSEEYSNYLMKNKKKKYFKTEEGFSLDFNSTLSDLRNSYFIHVNNDESYNYIKQNLNVIEEV